ERRRDTTVERLGDASRDARQSVGVSPEGNRVANRVLEARGFQERDERLRNRPLAGLVEAVGRTDLIEPSADVVAESLLQREPDSFPGLTLTGVVDRGGSRLRSLDPLRVIVRDGGASLGPAQHVFQALEGEPYRTDAHGGAVTEAP